MSEEVQRVTSDKPKNPGRQEWGRKLGKMQKEIKLKKQNDGLRDSFATQELKSDIDVKSNSFLKWEYVVVLGGIAIGAAALYYRNRRYEIARDDRPSVVEVQDNCKSQDAISGNQQVKFSDF